jgi:hypothetical protein
MGLFSRFFARWRRRRTRAHQHHHAAVGAPAPRQREQVARRQPRARSGRPGDAFTPTRPKSGRHLVGREVELQRILGALLDERAHVVLYSERGRGKTSLANLVSESLRRNERIVARYTCEASSNFESIIRGLARDLPTSLLAVAAADASADCEGCEAALPTGALQPRDVAALPSRLNCRDLVCVIDEFDRIEDPSTRARFADTIKQVSDRGIGLNFVIVGVSENLEQILGQHPSIQRAICAIHLPLLTDAEIVEMLTRGSRDSGLVFPQDVIARVSVIADGMPYMAQLLGLRIAQSVLARTDDTAGTGDFRAAVDQLVAETRANVVAQYARLTDGGQDQAMIAALRRIATAEQDRWGRITAFESANGVMVGGREVTALAWLRLREENVLRPTPESPSLFAFGDRFVIYHVLLLAAQAGEDAGASRPVLVADAPLAAPVRIRPQLAANG